LTNLARVSLEVSRLLPVVLRFSIPISTGSTAFYKPPIILKGLTMRNFTIQAVMGLLLYIFAFYCFALEPEPRKWNHLPMNVNFSGVTYVYSEADIFTDPALKLENVELVEHIWLAKYIRTFEVFNKSARIDITQGYIEAEWQGLLDGTPAKAKRSGLSDSFVTISVNLYGAPPLEGKAYRAYRVAAENETIVGVALKVRLPTGEYMDDKLLNLGGNRFVFKPQVGMVHNWGQWTVEATGEVAYYMDNNEFFDGNKLEQRPLYFVHGHLMYTVRSGLWVGVSTGYDYGGSTHINGQDKIDKKENVGWVLSATYPISPTMGAKLGYIDTRTKASTGLDSQSLTATLSYLW